MGMSVDDVIHSAFNKVHYDPAQRHERYLRQRQLKGRQGGSVDPGAGGGGNFNPPGGLPHVNRTQAQQAASSARQIAQIKGRLSNLKAHLKELLAKQKAEQAKSSSSSKSSTSTASKSGATKGPTPPQTAKQKQAAQQNVKKAQQASAAKQKATPDQKPKELPLEDQIVRTRAIISVVESKLKTAIEQSSTSQTASNGR